MVRGIFFCFILILASCGERVIDFSTARQVASERFNAHEKDVQPEVFMPLEIQDRGTDWHFEWKRRDGSGSVIVIVLRNGEFSDGISYPVPNKQMESPISRPLKPI